LLKQNFKIIQKSIEKDKSKNKAAKISHGVNKSVSLKLHYNEIKNLVSKKRKK